MASPLAKSEVPWHLEDQHMFYSRYKLRCPRPSTESEAESRVLPLQTNTPVPQATPSSFNDCQRAAPVCEGPQRRLSEREVSSRAEQNGGGQFSAAKGVVRGSRGGVRGDRPPLGRAPRSNLFHEVRCASSGGLGTEGGEARRGYLQPSGATGP